MESIVIELALGGLLTVALALSEARARAADKRLDRISARLDQMDDRLVQIQEFRGATLAHNKQLLVRMERLERQQNGYRVG